MNLKNGIPKNITSIYTAEIVDVIDPEQIGRARVRVHGIHSSDIDIESLPWAVTLSSVDRLQNGDWVAVSFLDEFFQSPLVLGKIISRSPGQYSDLPDEATSLDVISTRRIKKEEFKKLVKDKNVGFELPSGTDQPVYSFNKVQKSQSGHISEIDDTPGFERILEMHRSGTYEEVSASGDKVVVVNGDKFSVIVDNKNMAVLGNCNITILGNANTTVHGNESVEVYGNSTKTVHGNVIITGNRIDLN